MVVVWELPLFHLASKKTRQGPSDDSYILTVIPKKAVRLYFFLFVWWLPARWLRGEKHWSPQLAFSSPSFFATNLNQALRFSAFAYCLLLTCVIISSWTQLCLSQYQCLSQRCLALAPPFTNIQLYTFKKGAKYQTILLYIHLPTGKIGM